MKISSDFNKTLFAAVSALTGLALIVLPLMAGLWHVPPSEDQAVQSLNLAVLENPKLNIQLFKKTMVDPKAAPELSEPKAWLPPAQDRSDWGALLSAGESCEMEKLRAAGLDPRQKKWAHWFLAECTGEPLPAGYFSHAPFITPLGGSYVYWHLVYSRQNFDKKTFLTENFSYLHLLEHWQPSVADVVAPPFLAQERDLSLSTLQALLQGEFMTTTPTSLLVYVTNYDGFQITPLQEAESLLRSLGYKFAHSPNCTSYLYGARECLSALPEYQINQIPWIMMLVGCGLILTGLLVMGFQLLEAQHAQAKTREILLHTLSHEMRHPASSLRLSLEVLRGQFDDLPSATQGEFLRMSSQLQRMNRLMQLAAGADGSAVRQMSLADVTELVASSVEPYKEKILLQEGPRDLWILVDAPWFSLCLQNLIKNSLIHGRPPVEVSFHADGEEVCVCVADQGAPPALTFTDMIQPLKKSEASGGMGLGLSITHSVLEQMEGQLRFQESPKQFQMVFKRQQPAQQRKAS